MLTEALSYGNAPGDVNFNSPNHHHSSQDGSFIQDEAGDMHLILDFNPSANPALNPKTLADFTSPRFQPTSVLSESWIRHQRAQWATDFDANIAELDFDSVSATREILSLPQNGYVERTAEKTGDQQEKFWASIGEECLERRDWNDNCGVFSLPNLEGPMKGSLELSSGESLFSSAAIDSEETAMQLLLNQEQAAATAGFISTDSLDASTFDPEVLKAACETRKTDYCLTFATSRINDSCMAPRHLTSTPDNYRDAKLSSAADLLGRDKAQRELERSTGLTTWGRIRRSYDMGFHGSQTQHTPKSSSLPNLGSPVHCQMGAGEGMLSGHQEMQIFNLTASQHHDFDSQMGGRLSLLRVFRDRLNLALPDDSIDDSSGYVTAEGTRLEQISEDNQRADYEPTPSTVDDYEYTEFYVGNGRYVDVNHNEIGFVPPSTQGIQHVQEDGTPRPNPSPSDDTLVRDRWAVLPDHVARIAPAKPPRTFATLLATSVEGQSESDRKMLRDSGTQVPVYVVDQSVQTTCADSGRLVTTVVTTSVSASSSSPVYVSKTITQTGNPRPSSVFSPDLSFMKLAHPVPALLKNANPFPLSLLSPNESMLEELTQNPMPANQMPTKHPLLAGANQALFATDCQPANFAKQAPLAVNQALMGLPNPPQSLFGFQKDELSSQPSTSKQGVPRDRDSGLGASGPAHIQDWDSLATLLPKDVVQACSFFKNNSQLLQKRSYQQFYRDDLLHSIDKPANFRRQRRPMSECRLPSRHRSRFESIREECDCEARCHASAPCHGCYPPPCNRHCGALSTPPCHSTPCCRAVITTCHHHHHHCCQSPPRFMEREKSNLNRWRCRRSYSSSPEFEDSQMEESTKGHKLRNRPMPEMLSPSSSEDDLLTDSCYLPETMFSEYQLRERHPAVVPREFRSLQNVKLAARESSPKVRPCATCYRLRSPEVEDHPPIWAQPPEKREIFCDCETSDILEQKELERRRFRRRRPGEMHHEEMAVRNTPTYRRKKELVDRVVRVCDDLVSLFSELRKHSSRTQADGRVWELVHNSLCPAVELVVADGLSDNFSIWHVVEASATLGPATKSVHELVTDLSSTYGHANGEHHDPVQFREFVDGLLRLRSLDCWLSYLALKDKLLEQYYSDGAFVRRAYSAFRSLFERLVLAVQPLSLMPFPSRSAASPRRRFSLIPTRLPSDSRVPKSSSIPSKLTQAQAATRRPKSSSVDTGLAGIAARGSRIPVLKSRKRAASKSERSRKTGSVMSISDSAPMDWEHEEQLANECHIKRSATKPEELRLATAIVNVIGDKARGFLTCREGDGLEVLSNGPGSLVRCRKMVDPSEEGLIARNKVTFVSLL